MLHQPVAFANVVTLNEDEPLVETAAESTDTLSAVRPSCEELVDVLQRVGATVVVRQEHGVFLRVRRHLVFVRRRSVIDDAELRDALRAAELTVHRFNELLANSRLLSA